MAQLTFTEKITNTSEDGIETVNFSLRGDAPQGKFITVGISTPVNAARSGDISFAGVPNAGGYLGHIFAEGEWRRFGVISQERDRHFIKVDQIGIGQSGVGVFGLSRIHLRSMVLPRSKTCSCLVCYHLLPTSHLLVCLMTL